MMWCTGQQLWWVGWLTVLVFWMAVIGLVVRGVRQSRPTHETS